MRFLHTADWQIGMRAAQVGAAGARVREERLAAGQRLVRVAQEQGAEFILVAGDTFEDNGVDRVLVQRVADVLGAFGGPVYVLPGNHDPLVAGSVWDHGAWAAHANIVVLKTAAPLEVPGGTIWACPLFDKYGRSDPTAWISAARQPEHGIRVGVAHGTIEGLSTDEMYYPLPRDAAETRGLDYLALGHWHSFATFAAGGMPARMAYSGSHESTKFGERDSGSALMVQIDAPGAAPVLTPVRTGRLRWHQWNETLAAEGDLARLVERVQAIESPEAALLDLQIGGVLAAADQPLLIRLRELLAARLFYSRIDETLLRPSPSDSTWLAQLPPGAVRQAAERLQAWSDPAYAGGDRPADTTAATAAKALMELFMLTSPAEASR